jgi:hypothetical protein
MATKKRKAAKREAPKIKPAQSKAADETEKPDFTDEEIFEHFGVGTETSSLPLRKFISGQRKINGKLYVAIDKILDSLTKGRGPIDASLAEALRINSAVPGEPPACNRGGGGGGP